MKDFLVGVGIGLLGQSTFAAGVGSSIRRIDHLGKEIARLQASAARAKAIRRLAPEVGRTATAAREATLRATALGRALHTAAQPTLQLRRQFETARNEARRLSERLAEQQRQLHGYRTAMRQAGEGVRDLTKHERDLDDALAERSRLQGLRGRRDQARTDRGQARGELIEAVGIGYAVARPLMGAVGAAVRFESAMADVRKVVDFPTPEAFQAMGKSVREMSTRIPVAAEGLAAIMAAAGQANVPRAELQGFTEDAAKVAVAFDLTGEQAGSAMAGLRSIFGLGQQGAMDLAGALNHLSNNMDATAPGLLDIANRAGSMGRLFGLTGQQIGALGATFLQLKTPPEVAATGINAMLQRLQTADQQSSGFRDALTRIGLSAEGMRDHIARDAQGALLGFLEAVEGADDKAGILFQLLGQEYADDIQKLVGGLDHYRRALGLASDENANAASIIAEYEQRAKTTEHALTLFQNRTNQLAAAVGSALLPPLNATLETLGPMVSWVASLAEANTGLTAGVVGLTAALAGLNIASKAIRWMWAGARGAWASARMTAIAATATWSWAKATVAAGWAARKTALATVYFTAKQWLLNASMYANPAVWAIGAVVALGAVIYAFWRKIRGVWEWFEGSRVGRFFGLESGAVPPAGRVGSTAVAAAGEKMGLIADETNSGGGAAGRRNRRGRRRPAPDDAAPAAVPAVPGARQQAPPPPSPEMPGLAVPEMPGLAVPEMPGLAVPEMPGLAVPEMPGLASLSGTPAARQTTIHVERPVIEVHAAPGVAVDEIAAMIEDRLEQMVRDAQRAADRAQDDG